MAAQVEGGKALVAVLSGDVNPSGKLAMTFPRNVGQVLVFYCERPRARRDQGFYQDISTEPLYGFAYGLSYTDYSYGDIEVEKNENGTYTATVAVTNTGDRDGLETVHWFVSDPVSSISRPAKELKFFEKKAIAKGETAIYVFEIDPNRDLAFVNAKGEPLLERGEYIISVKDKKAVIDF